MRKIFKIIDAKLVQIKFGALYGSTHVYIAWIVF